MDFDAELDKLVADKKRRDEEAVRAADHEKAQKAAFRALWNDYSKDVLQPTLESLEGSLRSRRLDVKLDHSIDLHTGAVVAATLTVYKPVGPLRASSYLKVEAGFGVQRVNVETYIHGSGEGAVKQVLPFLSADADFLKAEAMKIARSILT